MNISQLLQTVDLPSSLLNDRVKYLQVVRTGIPGAIVKEAITMLQERELFINLLETSSANLNRFYRQELLNKSQSEGILDVLRVFQQAIDVFEDNDKAREWLHTSIPALAGEIPISLCDTFAGRQLVTEALSAIEYGEFS